MTNGEHMGYNPRQQKIADASRLVEEAQKNLTRARDELDRLVNPPIPDQPPNGAIIRVSLKLTAHHSTAYYIAIRNGDNWYIAGPGAPLGGKSWEQLCDFINDAWARMSPTFRLHDAQPIEGFRVDD